MTQIFNVYSRFTAPLDSIQELVRKNKIDLPEAISEINLNRVNGKLHIESTAADDSFSRYTPLATIKAGLTDKTIVVDDDGEVTHQTVSTYKQDLGWSTIGEEEKLDTKTITYVDFYGRGDEILVHKALRAEMFEILCSLTSVGTRGHVNGILLEDDELQPVWFEAGGDTCDVEISIEKTKEANDREESADKGTAPVNWSQHS